MAGNWCLIMFCLIPDLRVLFLRLIRLRQSIFYRSRVILYGRFGVWVDQNLSFLNALNDWLLVSLKSQILKLKSGR